MELLNSNNLFAPIKYEAPKSKARGQRALLIEDFVTELNRNAGTKYKVGKEWKVVKEVKPSFIAFKLSHLTVADLFHFYSTCKGAKCGFSKCFYGALKTVDRPFDFKK